MTLRAGAATVDITPPVGVMMDGYGARIQPSRAIHDPLFARVLVLDDGRSACAIAGTDLLGMHPWITDQVRDGVSRATGIAADHVLVSATHNHAGPAGLRGGMFSRLDEALAAETALRIARATEEAWRSRRPATLKVGLATVDTVSMNRRHPDWPIDPTLRVLLVDGEDGPVATLLNFSCHATVLNASNLELSAEFPGAACRLLQEKTGAPCVYLNGACGDVNPTWIRQDFQSMERLGQIVGSQALRIVAELEALGPGQRAHNIRWDEFPEKSVPGHIVEPGIRAALREIELPLREFPSDEEYTSRTEEARERAQSLRKGSGERREAMAELTRLQAERWAAAWARRLQRSVQRTQIQALRLGLGLAVLALPGEFFAVTGEAVRRRARFEDLFTACYANDYIGYVIPPEAYEQGGYEAGITFCTPEAEELVVLEATRLLREMSP
jgi:hypothetical protein